MSDLPTANAPYIKKTFDEFRDLTTVTHKKELKCGGFLGSGGVNNEYIFQLRQVKTKEMSNLVLDCSIRAEDWFFARQGKITFNCDQQNVHIPYHESNTNVDHIGDTSYCFEYGYYELTTEILELLCSCSVLKIRITGDSVYEEPNAKWCAGFQTYCRQFYNNAINPEKFQEQETGKSASPETGRAQKIGYELGKSLAGTSALGNKLAKWLGIGLAGFAAVGILAAIMSSQHDEKKLEPAVLPAAVPLPPPVKQTERSNVPQAIQPQDQPVVQNTQRQEIAQQTPNDSGIAAQRPPEQTQTSMANVAASDNSAKQQLSPENVNDTATQNKTAKSLDAEKPLPAKEPLNLAGKWEGFFQCGPHFYDQSPRGQRSFNVKAAAEITGGKITMHRGDTNYQEDLKGLIDRKGSFRMEGEGFYMTDRDRPWQTVAFGAVDRKSDVPRLEGTATINFGGRKVRDCTLVLTRS